MVQQQPTLVNNYLELRAFAYDVLRHVFLQEPTKQFLNMLRDSELQNFPFVEEHPLILAGVKEIKNFFNEHEVDEVFESLHWDYTRLFIGPYELPAPLWESAYINKERLLFQKETLVVRQAYLKYNFLPQDFGKEADDHLGLELDFLYQLNQLTMEAVQIKNEGETNQLIKDQMSFIENHPLKWVPQLRVNISQHAKFDFYIAMAKILQGFLEVDKACLEEVIAIKQ